MTSVKSLQDKLDRVKQQKRQVCAELELVKQAKPTDEAWRAKQEELRSLRRSLAANHVYYSSVATAKTAEVVNLQNCIANLNAQLLHLSVQREAEIQTLLARLRGRGKN